MAQMPQLPRQTDVLRASELMPFRSKKINLLKSRALVPLVVTALVCVALFGLLNEFFQNGSRDVIYQYFMVVAWFTVFVIFTGVYMYGGERKMMLWYLLPCFITLGQLYYFFRTPAFNPYTFVFRELLPGNTEVPHTDFVGAFVANLFGAGMMEELIKAVPGLAALGLALRLRRSGGPKSFVTRGLALEGPIDGLLIGVASGAGFIILETLTQYVPNIVRGVTAASNNEAIGFLAGFMLLIPRVLNGVIGHMAWAGISGYFIGLTLTHPGAAVRLLPIGWLIPASLHGFWNASSTTLPSWVQYVSALLSLFFFISCLLKAKQLEVSRLGGEIDGHSILAVTSASQVPSAPAGIVPPPVPGVAGVFTGAATAIERAVGVEARTTVPSAGATPPPRPVGNISIGTATVRYALAAGQVIDFSALFGAAGVPPGCMGSIGSATGGGFELRNTGTGSWPVTTPDGATRAVAPGGTVEAVNGARFRLGTATIDLRAY